jgi:hypothetical protein
LRIAASCDGAACGGIAAAALEILVPALNTNPAPPNEPYVGRPVIVESHNTSDFDLDIESTENAPKKGLTRRQVAVGAAWAAPVIALAVATPLASASTPIVPGDPSTYPDATFSGTTQTVSDPSLSATGNTRFAKTTFTAVSDDSDLASYKVNWQFIVASASPVSTDAGALTWDATLGYNGVVFAGGVYTYTWTLNTAAVSTFVKFKPSALSQISFTLVNTDLNVNVGSATAFPKP